MDVSIILVNYNTCKMTLDCIASIYEHTSKVSFEVIVVDNESHDESQAFFAADKRVVFVESGDNLGFGRANNLGLKYAKGKYVFFLNTDTLLENNAIEIFYEYSEKHSREHIGAIGCPLVGADGKPTFSSGHFLKIGKVFLTLTQHFGHVPDIYGKNKKILGDNDLVANVDYVSGANVFVRKDVVDQFGAFDPDFFMYYEETEMQYRWTKMGYLSYVIKTPQIIHLEGGSQEKNTMFRSDKFIRSFESEKLYFKKTRNKLDYLIYRFSALIYLMVFVKKKLTLRDFCMATKALICK